MPARGAGRGKEARIPTLSISREWLISPPHAEREAFARSAGVSPLIAQLLLNRGVSDPARVRPFLEVSPSELLQPGTLPGAVEAADRLATAVRNRRRIVIYGDYDVDGVTAITILWHALRLAGADVHYYVPSRLDEGYGLNAAALEQIAADGGQLVISVDCGITAVEPVRAGKAAGLEIIVSDHHQAQDELPEADVVVHPVALGPSPNPHLSGAGVAFKIAWALCQRLSGTSKVPSPFREFLVEATAFAALGLIADVVPLVGENRVLASFGLHQLARSSNAGLRALIEVSGLAERRSCDDYDAGFILAPRLNAIGRLGHARLAVELFTRADAERAREIASTLDQQNRKRQELEKQISRQAEAQVIERGFDRESCRGIVLASPDWHPGVIGIVASRLVERFHRPTILIALDDQLGQGSGRSVRHFPLHEALSACSAHLVSHGGHAMAAGVKIRPDRVEAFTDAFLAQASQRLTAVDLRPCLRLDDEVSLGALTLDVAETLQKLAPFGEGNPRPRLATGAVQLVDSPRVVGKAGTHLQLSVRENGHVRKCIAFGRAADALELAEHRTVRLAFEPIINEWNGRRSVELRVLDWKPGDT